MTAFKNSGMTENRCHSCLLHKPTLPSQHTSRLSSCTALAEVKTIAEAQNLLDTDFSLGPT